MDVLEGFGMTEIAAAIAMRYFSTKGRILIKY